MNKTDIKRNIASVIGMLVLAFLAVGSTDEGSSGSKDDKARNLPEGNIAIINADRGTSLQKDENEKKYQGTTLQFVGVVKDVTSATHAQVMIDSSNYCNVEFSTATVGSLNMGDKLKFTAKIKVFGTGLLFKHELTDAKLEP